MLRRFFCKIVLIAVVVCGLLALSGVLLAQGRSEDAFDRVTEVQERHTERLMAIEDVEGTAVGLDENGQHQVTVFTARQGVGGIPRNLEGVPVEVVVTGKFYALAKPSVLPGQAKRPAAPTDLRASAVSSSQINLSWTDKANNQKEFKIERKKGTGSFVQIATVGTNKTSYSNTGLQASTTYTYRVRAYNDAGNSGYSNEAFATTFAPEPRLFPRPAPIGVSTGNEGECSAGTIGCRVTDGTNVYALSNNHVYALENEALRDSEVLQPGLYDTGCVYNSANVIGTLSAYVPIVFNDSLANNEIDAAIAISSTANLGTATPAGGYGRPSSKTATASVGLAVQKYGRTTLLTKGTVTGTNVIVNVGYSSGTARFVNQIYVRSNTKFIGAGDSGSLLVTDPDKNPVGLLFAGTSDGKLAVANPIGAVLDAFGVDIDSE